MSGQGPGVMEAWQLAEATARGPFWSEVQMLRMTVEECRDAIGFAFRAPEDSDEVDDRLSAALASCERLVGP